MKIIFLDIDGVLNSYDFWKKSGEEGVQLDPDALTLLKGLVDASGARLVLTSSWRLGWSADEKENGEEGRILDQELKKVNLTLMDKTGEVDIPFPQTRCVEILNWLENTPESVESFVILDDADYAWKKYGLARFLVQTDFEDGGLKACHVTRALEILQKPPKTVKTLLRGLAFRLTKCRR